MSKQLYDDEDVLKILDIDNFRHLSKDKAVALANMNANVKPETIGKAMEQMPSPALIEFGTAVIANFSQIAVGAQNSSDASSKAVMDACTQVLDACTEKLESGDLDPETEKNLIDLITTVLQLMREQDSANKRFNLELVKKAGQILALVAAAIGGIAYTASKLLSNDTEDDKDDENNDDDGYDIIYSDDEDE